MQKLLLMGLLAFIVACDTSKPPLENQIPVTAFTVNATVQAGTSLTFTSTSSDPDGDALTLSWDFADGVRGGGLSIAHVFAKAGSFNVKLTASDGKGGISSDQKSIVVSASNVVAGNALSVIGTIIDATGAPLAGVSVNLEGTVLGSSDASGKITVTIPTGVPLNLILSKNGFAQSFAALEFPIGSNANNADFKATMLARAAAQSLNANTGGALTGTDNARLEIPANSLETLNGTPVTGSVNVSLTPVDINDEKEKNAFPGSFEGMQQNGVNIGIVSLGTTEFNLEQNGQRLNLKPGSSAKIRLPMYADTNLDGSSIKLGDAIPLWSLNEQTGDWVQEGTGIVVDSGAGTRALEAVVTHFS
jgi:PKD repeat protein